MAESKPDVAGCAVAVWAILVTSPMWLILLFALMQANSMPMWAWVLYWCYVPAQMMGVIMGAFWQVVIRQASE